MKDINEDFIKTESLLREVYKEDRQECLKSLLESWDIVTWIAATFKSMYYIDTNVQYKIMFY